MRTVCVLACGLAVLQSPGSGEASVAMETKPDVNSKSSTDVGQEKDISEDEDDLEKNKSKVGGQTAVLCMMRLRYALHTVARGRTHTTGTQLPPGYIQCIIYSLICSIACVLGYQNESSASAKDSAEVGSKRPTRHSDIDRHVCVCDKSFSSKASLQAHKTRCAEWRRYHNGAHQVTSLPYVCVCNKSFAVLKSLKAHRSTCPKWRSSQSTTAKPKPFKPPPQQSTYKPAPLHPTYTAAITYSTLRCECGRKFDAQRQFAEHRNSCKVSIKKRDFMEGVLSLCRQDSSVVAAAAKIKVGWLVGL